MKEVEVKLHFSEEIEWKHNKLLAEILTTEAADGRLGIENPLYLIPKHGYLVDTERSSDFKVDVAGNAFTEDSPERLAEFKEKEVIRINNMINSIEDEMKSTTNHSYLDRLQLKVDHLKCYLIVLEEKTETPYQQPMNVIKFYVDGELTFKLEESVRKGIELYISQTNPKLEMISVSIIPV